MVKSYLALEVLGKRNYKDTRMLQDAPSVNILYSISSNDISRTNIDSLPLNLF